MSLKILLDCIVTAAPSKCSSSIQFVTWVNRALENHEDWFFYWVIPDWVEEEEFLAFYPQHERVRYFRLPQHKDRTKEYLTLRTGMDALMGFNGELWDFDIFVTVRTGLVPLARLISTSPREKGHTWLKQFWVIEEMPLMSFKKTVMTINADVQDRFTIDGYLAADKVWICSYHEKPEILQTAREFYSPTLVRKLDATIKPFVSMQLQEFHTKPVVEQWSAKADRKFCVAYVGRMEKGNNIADVADLMQKQFVIKGSGIKLLVCTQSKVINTFDRSVVDARMATREEFWALAKTGMDVLVKLEPEGGFNLSLFEPLMFGVPAIVKRAPWSVGLLGKNYPYLVDNETQAYALVSMFHNDYPKMYAKFAEYITGEFWPVMNQRFEDDLLYTNLDRAAISFEDTVPGKFRAQYPNKMDSFIFKAIAKYVADKDDFVLFTVVQELGEAGEFHTLADKTKDGDRAYRSLAWGQPWNEIRSALKYLEGWQDASITVGHFKRGKPA